MAFNSNNFYKWCRLIGEFDCFVTLFQLNEVDAESEESGIAKKALFSKHAEMKNWPKDHIFKVYRLDIEEIFLIDFSSDPKPLTVDQYFLPGKEGRWE
ncbi:putative FMN-binding split barrel [Helianthus anomalus]